MINIIIGGVPEKNANLNFYLTKQFLWSFSDLTRSLNKPQKL